MKYLNTYKIFESVSDNQFFKSKKDIKNWLGDMNIDKYTINDDLSVDTHGEELNISFRSLEYIPVQFNIVKGPFWCSSNKLKSLKGSPKYLIQSKFRTAFYCNNNNLTSMEYCSPEIDYQFNCMNNNIFDLKGLPKILYSSSGEYIMDNNPIDRLLDRIQNIIGDYYFERKKREFIYHLNDFDVIKKNNIFLDKLGEVMDLMGFPFDFKEANKISDNFLGFTKLGYNIIE